jgi:hypothetical protein
MKTKTFDKKWIVLAVLSVLATGFAGCGGGGSDAVSDMNGPGGRGQVAQAAGLQVDLASLPVQDLSTAEKAGLLAMREEEQLAHDVYAASAQQWSLPVFANIANSETTHVEAVATLLDRYDLPDPMGGVSTGAFPTPAFQALYDSLTARSRNSLIDALQVGCEIEELDMRDIVAHQLAVDNADIRLVYDNLLRGSRNHLRAFYATLIRQGGSYVPKYLSSTEFEAIVNSAMETGR